MEYQISNKMKNIDSSAISEILKYVNDPNIISFAGGNPAPETFPYKELAKTTEKLLKASPVLSLQYNATEGYSKLRNAISKRLEDTENINSKNNDLIVVSGGQQAIDLTAKCLLNEGDSVIVEEPSFIGALNSFRSYGARLCGVPMEDDGISISALKKTIDENKNIKIIYTIPNFQNPTGITMSLLKRKAVYDLARKNGIIIIEDNPYGELTFDNSHIPPIKSFDRYADTVIYCGSFSKILAPGLRLGYCTGPRKLISKIIAAKQISDVHTPILNQLMAYEYMREYDLNSNIKRSASLYSHKCALMLKYIDLYFPKKIKHTYPKGGLFIWCDMGNDYNTLEISKRCIEKGVVFVPGNAFMCDMSKPCSCFRLNYSTMTDDKIEEGIKILGEVLYEIMD